MPPSIPGMDPRRLQELMQRATGRGLERVELVHRLARRLWAQKRWTLRDLQDRCQEGWDALEAQLGVGIRPLVPAPEDRPAANLILGSGSFSTGAFQAAQFAAVARYAPKPPVVLQGLVANRSEANGCQAAKVSQEHDVPLIELDFADWFHENVDGQEANPVSATRFWFPKGDPKRPADEELARRFDVRQHRYHGALGAKIAETVSGPTDIASARGYSFALGSALFRGQHEKPHANDTHPADLTYVDPMTKAKVYPGWQSGPVERMMKNGHGTVRGSLIEIEYMDRVGQIDELDEGALLAVGEGVRPEPSLSAKDVQAAMKLIDDHVFCTLEPTGLLFAWGVTEKPLPIEFQDVSGGPVQVRQRAIVVGNEARSGVRAWGQDLRRDLEKLEAFLLGP